MISRSLFLPRTVRASRLCGTARTACVTREVCPISNRLLTQRRVTVVCWHSHHANTRCSIRPLAMATNPSGRNSLPAVRQKGTFFGTFFGLTLPRKTDIARLMFH